MKIRRRNRMEIQGEKKKMSLFAIVLIGLLIIVVVMSLVFVPRSVKTNLSRNSFSSSAAAKNVGRVISTPTPSTSPTIQQKAKAESSLETMETVQAENVRLISENARQAIQISDLSEQLKQSEDWKNIAEEWKKRAMAGKDWKEIADGWKERALMARKPIVQIQRGKSPQ